MQQKDRIKSNIARLNKANRIGRLAECLNECAKTTRKFHEGRGPAFTVEIYQQQNQVAIALR